jgi:hypothetical protein
MGTIGPTGPTGQNGPMGCEGPTGLLGPMGFEGPTGVTGPSDPTGPLGTEGGPTDPTISASDSTGPVMNAIFNFATSESVNAGDFIGFGNSSSSLLRNTIVVPFTCDTSYLMLHLRNFSDKKRYTATLWINDSPSTLTTFIPEGVSVKCATGYGTIQLNSCDLITIQITYTSGNGGALVEGVSASLVVKPK